MLRMPKEISPGTASAFDRRLLVPMILGAVLNPINSSIVAVSLVPIGRAFDAPSSDTAWLVSALYLATAVGQPVVGRLVDTQGPRRLFLAGAVLTGVAGVVGTLAPSLPVLVVARVILGFGTCAGYPAAMSLIRSEADRTGQDSPSSVLTALAVSSQTITVIGPTLGGLLIGAGGWRTTLAINIPLALACLMLGARLLPRRGVAEENRGAGLDLPGIALFSATLVALLLFLMELGNGDWPLLVLALVLVPLFAWRELRAPDPFIDLRVLGGNLALVRTFVRSLLTMTVAYSFLYGFTQWMEDGRGLSAAQTGLILLPMSLVAIAVSTVTGPRPEIRLKLVVGAVTQVAASAVLLAVDAGSGVWLLVIVALLVGIPQGLNNLANQNAVYHQADPSRIGSSAGLLRTFGYLGAIIASAATGGFFGARANTHGLHELAVFLLIVAVLFLLLTVLDRALGAVGTRTDNPRQGAHRAPQHA